MNLEEEDITSSGIKRRHSEKRILTIIVTYNGEKWIRRCIPPLLTPVQSYTDIICIDNASSDATLDMLSELYPHVLVNKQSSNLGFGKACNIGLEHARRNNYDYVLLLNQDAEISQDSITELIDIAESQPHIGIISPIHLNDEGRIDKLFLSCLCNDPCLQIFSDLLTRKFVNNFYHVKFVNAAVWLLSKRCIKKVQTFDPIFPHYGEDDDFASHVRESGMKIAIAPSVFAIHHRSQDEKTRPQESSFQSQKNREHVRFLLQYKRLSGGKLRRYFYLFRYFIAEAITRVLLLEIKELQYTTTGFWRFTFYSLRKL